MRYLNYHSAAKNKLLCVLSIPTMILSGSGSVGAADDLWLAAHGKFISAFNQRDWSAVAAMMSDDSVFHRATGNEVFIGPKAIVERFSSTIGAEDQWNVKFAKLDTTESLTGKDGRVVERGDFAVTAGDDSSACYAGSFMMTWKINEDTAKLQTLAWQDVEVDISMCK